MVVPESSPPTSGALVRDHPASGGGARGGVVVLFHGLRNLDIAPISPGAIMDYVKTSTLD